MKTEMFLIAILAFSTSLYAGEAPSYLQKALPLVNSSKYADAVKILEQGIASKEKIAGRDYLYGWAMYCHAILGDYDKAAEYYKTIRIKYEDGAKSDGRFGHRWDHQITVTRTIITMNHMTRARSAKAYRLVVDTDKEVFKKQRKVTLYRIQQYYARDFSSVPKLQPWFHHIDLTNIASLLSEGTVRLMVVKPPLGKENSGKAAAGNAQDD